MVGAIDSGLADLYVRDMFLDKPFVIHKKGLAIGGAVSPQSIRPPSARASRIQKIRKKDV